MKQKITPFLWFDGKAEEAANFYVSVFRNSKILKTARYGDDPDPAKSKKVMEAMLQMKKIDIAGLRRAYEAGA